MKFLKQRWFQLLLTIAVTVTLGVLLVLLTHEETVTVSINQLNVRSGPNVNYKTVHKAKLNSRLVKIGEKNLWHHVRYDDRHTGWVASWLVNRRTNLKEATNLSEATIVIDPGHGGNDSGALHTLDATSSKYMEKTYTLKVAQEVAADLRRHGAHVIMTRNSDKYVGLAPRPAIANEVKADAFISIHFDSSPEENQSSGLTTYYYHKNISMKLAKALNSQMNHYPMSNKGIEFGNFEVIRDNQRPAVLLEMGYINDQDDFKTISGVTYPYRVAHSITKGLTDYFSDAN
ncbi:N-acetylmuramoyl-L-alanine amidase [Furfurilactobacillus milii]|uniref:N-acetylmuramoyl-L-alanine amidase n=1 Tax=Furfurilactobacillus milii TaxID=2888272 RepID=A0ABT6D6X1_9LACO|nr:N-acetylmuramoyl-L-alanine amidase [Furfurilactobacillus milii]QLE66474.1 N-acetylmuramoyl-L-alanine amidase [Furfurilactobacillus rossiae]MCF6159930.1 N-acetylmuramoyl-L-alanine amidase [Furfurilactobacillus milii]MCF6162521.1 N-acetylmuramoyl-L-alanine amidase [Furfurilactobacillus milii]MDF9912892.1 N-acetylmuramoyl-L-alanine amidase [Furfurilactobacillus milii]QLE68904.1 N-acetylmuramoyl-L-alanine amidase [Furfurilactobacillus rossiae]